MSQGFGYFDVLNLIHESIWGDWVKIKIELLLNMPTEVVKFSDSESR